MKNTIIISLCYFQLSFCLAQTKKDYLQDESKVENYTLPALLRLNNGKQVKTTKEWENSRRPELLKTFAEEVYGKTMASSAALPYRIVSVNKNALNGIATRKEVQILLSKSKGARQLNLIIYTPNQIKEPVPVFLGLNFSGNQEMNTDTGITITKYWTRFAGEPGFSSAGIANEKSRARSEGRWNVELILSSGYGVATAYYGDLQLDRKDIYSLPDDFNKWYDPQKELKPDSSQWGAIGIWAWGLSRALDYLEKDPSVNAKKVAVIGHSRLGKAALWAGAQDKRFAMVISNNSGEGGAAITRRKFGETIKRINTSFPHWFADNFKKYNDKEASLPIDFHELMALIAPRPLYVASASEDLWADPVGEYTALFYAGDIYKLYGFETFKDRNPPATDTPVRAGVLGYHKRTGKHDITKYDWEQYINFADLYLK
ncbi:hypothetical protein [Pedobacter heparinus]|uniref:4-O-methyl-glucuronoyl methylesterase-like domain-containing protein n=1 Tax=Pedobacter heparinus (strain ATCC 13125 / DSM 2366 / CIP 104194 / JCM 7457 / NBRC 12017 / NCIMB 9290 / NRRL B-14731 / HIM 762-3) TaxID=485917 RepID=C6XTT3_PEDHD|nr:hypothetical protein [Pedobacter heparinus]ACU03719.1 hypothetical protein Phep_1505 [Pedobacter heparinus DSM 2366]